VFRLNAIDPAWPNGLYDRTYPVLTAEHTPLFCADLILPSIPT
jgi:hypothetical protein